MRPIVVLTNWASAILNPLNLKTPNGPSRSCPSMLGPSVPTLSTTMVPPVLLDSPKSSNVPSRGCRLSPTLGSGLACSRSSTTQHVRLPTDPLSPRKNSPASRNFHPSFASPTQLSRLRVCAPRRRLLDVSLVPVQEPRERN